MQLETKIALFGGVIPGVVSLAVLLPAWRRARRAARSAGEGGDGPVWIAPVLVLLAFLMGDYAVNGPPSLWTPHGPARYIHAVGLIALVGVLDALVRMPMWAVAVLRALALGGGVWALGRPYVPQAVSEADFVGWLALGSIGGCAVLTCVELGARAMCGVLTPVVLLVTIGASGAIVTGNGLAYAAMTAAGPCAVLGAAIVVGVLAPGLTLARGGAATIAGIALLWIIGAIFQTGVRTTPAVVLLALAPAGLIAAWALRERSWRVRLGVSALVIGTCLAGAGAATWLAQPEPYDPGS